MGDQRRWAARYQFLEQLWSGRDRIVCDRELEAALHAGVEGPVATLLDALIPSEGGDARAWVALHNDRRAARFARTHSGTVFTGLDDAPELASDEGWQVALVNLDSGETAELEAFLEILGERAEDDPDRSVVLTIDSGDDEDARYEELALIVEELFGDGRVYGLTRPGMAAFYDSAPVLDPEHRAAEDAPVGVEVDNTLGTEEPRFEAFVAVVGGQLPGEGVTFVELPVFEREGRGGERGEAGRAGAAAAASGATRAEQEELAALRVQLAEAQRLGDMQAIERQSLLEQLEQAEDRIASLDDELVLLREGADAIGESSAAPADGPRLDEVLAREQALHWELDRLRGELDNLRARPVGELEAEAASLRAKLERVQSGLAPTASDELDADIDELVDGLVDEMGELSEATLAELAATLEADPSPARARAWMQARGRVEHLLRKLERGGRLSALELHRELRRLRDML